MHETTALQSDTIQSIDDDAVRTASDESINAGQTLSLVPQQTLKRGSFTRKEVDFSY